MPSALILAAFDGDIDEVRRLLATPEGRAMVEVGSGSVSFSVSRILYSVVQQLKDARSILPVSFSLV